MGSTKSTYPKRLSTTPTRLFFSKYFNPMSYLRGFGDLEGGQLAAKLSRNMLQYEHDLLANYAVPDLLVILKGPVDEERGRRAAESWANRHMGENRGSTCNRRGRCKDRAAGVQSQGARTC